MQKEITFIVTFNGGSGSIVFTGVDGLNGDKTLICDPANPVSPQTFTADQSTGPQTVTVGGAAPVGGSIEVEIKDDDTTIGSGTYKDLFINQDINYTVKP